MLNVKRIEQMRQESDVYVDRTIFSTIAYHRAYGLPDFWINVVPSRIIDQYSGMIYFSVNEEERKRRLMSRYAQGGTMTVSDKKSFDLGVVLEREYRRLFDKNTIEVSTNNKTQQQVAKEAIESIYGR